MAQIFDSSNLPGIEGLPISRRVIDVLNDAESSNSDATLGAVVRAIVASTIHLETRLNLVQKAVGVEFDIPDDAPDGVKAFFRKE